MATRFVIGQAVNRVPSRVEETGGAVVIRTLCVAQLESENRLQIPDHAGILTALQ